MPDYTDYSDYYRDYLLEELNDCKDQLASVEGNERFNKYTIIVAKERIQEKVPEKNAIIFVIKNLSGSYVLSVKTQPVQIMCWTEYNTIEDSYMILDLFAKLHHQNFWKENNILYKEDYEPPVVLKAFVENRDGYRGSMYCYGTYTVCESIADLEDLKWYNEESTKADKWEEVEAITTGITYAGVMNTTKNAGEKISTSLLQEAGLTLSFTMMNNNSNFCQKINKIMFGSISGNTGFLFSFKLNGITYTNVEFKNEQIGFSTSKTEAPGLKLLFRR